MGNLFLMPFRPAFDSAGVSVPGAKAYFTLAGTNTPSPVYSDAGLTTPLSNPLVANGVGKFPTAYMDPAISYRVRVYGRTATVGIDTPLEEMDPYSTSLFDTPFYAASRAELAALSITAGPAILTEAGREGSFVFRSTNFQTLFGASLATVDPRQMLYVAPTADPTGASGAWVRSGWTDIDARWSGAAFDDNGTAGTDDSAAIVAAIALSKALAGNVSTNGFYKAGPNIVLPAGKSAYMGTTALDITHSFALLGQGKSGQQGPAYPSRLRWAYGSSGIRVQRFDTSGVSTIDGATHFGGDGFVVEGVRLSGGYAGTEAEYHGIHAKARFIARNCYVDGWSGDGIYVHADTASGGADHGNANNTAIDTVTVVGCRDGLSIAGGDANAMTIKDLDTSANRRWGINDNAFLSLTYLSGHSDGNGLVPGTPPSVVSNGGNRYAIKDGQEANGSVTAPTGTADSSIWYYQGAGGVSAPNNIPAWSSGMTLRAGGSARFANANSQRVVLGRYNEGSQGPIQADAPTLIIGGQQVNGAQFGVKGSAILLWNSLGVLVAQALGAQNPAGTRLYALDQVQGVRFGDATFAPAEFSLQWYNSNLIWTYANSQVPSNWAYEITGETTTRNIGKRLLNFPNGYGLNDKKQLSGTAAPTSGTYVQGDVVWNSAPAAGGPPGWVCVIGGSPGTWKAMASLAA